MEQADATQDDLRELLELEEIEGTHDGVGTFTVAVEKIADRFRPLLVQRPELPLVTFLRVLHHLSPSSLKVTFQGGALDFLALGPFRGKAPPLVNQLTPEVEEARGPSATLNLLLLLLASGDYKGSQLVFQGGDLAWSYRPDEGAKAISARGEQRMRLSLRSPRSSLWKTWKAYLGSVGPYSDYPIHVDGDLVSQLRPLGAHSDLWLEVAHGPSKRFQFASTTPAMLEYQEEEFHQNADPLPVVAIRAISDNSSTSMLVRLSTERGEMGLRFLCQGVLTEPIIISTSGSAGGEIVIEDDSVATDFTGLQVLNGALDRDQRLEAERLADRGWEIVAQAKEIGTKRFRIVKGGFIGSDAGRIIGGFGIVGLWMLFCAGTFIQRFNALGSELLKVALIPVVLCLVFGPCLWLLYRIMISLGGYRAGEDPYVWIFHRYLELTRVHLDIRGSENP